MRVGVLLATALLLTACSSGGGKSSSAGSTPSPRAKQCTDRMLAGVDGDRGPVVRSYVERTYCDRFARQGWVYEGGTLSIKAQIWLMHAGSCSESRNGGPTVTVPCEPTYELFECGLLHFVRRAEAQAYIRQLSKKHHLRCDDGTPLDELGAT